MVRLVPAPRRSWLPLALALALAGAAAWMWLAPAAVAPVADGAAPPASDAGGGADAATPEAPRPSAPEAPPVSATAPPSCPDDEPDPPGLVRPSVSELLRLRTSELRDRLPQLSRNASPALRAGLRGLGGEDEDGALEALLTAPDRSQDGFDVAVAARLLVATRALSGGDLERADRHARAAVRAAPDDPLPRALLSLARSHRGDPAGAREAMVAAHALAPDEPALALAAARELATAGRFEEAARAAEVYLREVPGDARARSWRERTGERASLTRGHARRSLAGVEIAWPVGAVANDRIGEVVALVTTTLSEVARLMRHAPRAELAVVVYGLPEEMRRATCAPSWTGGVFDGVLHLDARTLASDRWRRVVRHEAVHAQLAEVRGRIPHWLNEGLAQWMEGEPSPRAADAWRRMVRDRFWIPFPSLEGRLMDIDDAADASLAYFQSLAMVRYLIDRRGLRGIEDALAHVEAGEETDLLERVVPGASGEALLAFLAR